MCLYAYFHPPNPSLGMSPPMMLTLVLNYLFMFSHIAFAINFPYESVQLQPLDVRNNSDIVFGNGTSTELPPCKTFPGYVGWPSPERWTAFNASLRGALLQGIPPAAACYGGEYENATRCSAVRSGQFNAVFA
jgi:hypothetical protein